VLAVKSREVGTKDFAQLSAARHRLYRVAPASDPMPRCSAA